MNPKTHTTRFILLMVILSPLGMDQYTPSLPSMTESLNTTYSLMQLTVTVYLVSCALTQLILGVYSDRYGRRALLLFIAPCYLLGCLICIFANDLGTVLFGRFIQGIGAGIFSLSSRTLMADCFKGEELNKISSLYSTIYAFVPIGAPLLGGFIQEYLYWQVSFMVMFFLAAITYIYAVWKLPETHRPTEQHQLNYKRILSNYKTVLMHKRYMLAISACCIIWGMQVSFSIISPYIVEETMGYTAVIYGQVALLCGLGIMMGGVCNTLLLRQHSPHFNSKLGLRLMLLAIIAFIMVITLGYLNLVTLTSTGFLLMFGAGILAPHLFATILSSLPELKGLSAALMGTLVTLGVAFITALLSYFNAHSAQTLMIVYTIAGILLLYIYRALFQKQNIPNGSIS